LIPVNKTLNKPLDALIDLGCETTEPVSDDSVQSDLESQLLPALVGDCVANPNTNKDPLEISSTSRAMTSAQPVGPDSRKRCCPTPDPAVIPTKQAKATKKEPAAAPLKKRRSNTDAKKSANTLPNLKTAAKRSNRKPGKNVKMDQPQPQLQSTPDVRATHFSDANTPSEVFDRTSYMNLHISGHNENIRDIITDDKSISSRRAQAHQRGLRNGEVTHTLTPVNTVDTQRQATSDVTSNSSTFPHGHSRESSYVLAPGQCQSPHLIVGELQASPQPCLVAQVNTSNSQLYAWQADQSPQHDSTKQRLTINPGRGSQVYSYFGHPCSQSITLGIMQPTQFVGCERFNASGISGPIDTEQNSMLNVMQQANAGMGRRAAVTHPSSTQSGPASTDARVDLMQDVTVRAKSPAGVSDQRRDPQSALYIQNLRYLQPQYRDQETSPDVCRTTPGYAQYLRQTAPLQIFSLLGDNRYPMSAPPVLQRERDRLSHSSVSRAQQSVPVLPPYNTTMKYGRHPPPPGVPLPVETDLSPANYAGILWPFYLRTIAVDNGRALYTFTDDELDALQETADLDRRQINLNQVVDELVATNQPSAITFTPSTGLSSSYNSSIVRDNTSNTSQDN